MCFALKHNCQEAAMKANVAVATVQGKSYFLIVNNLKENNIPFVSIMPGEPVPVEVKVVITTEKERAQVNFDRVLFFSSESDLNRLMSEVTITLQGKKAYEKIVIGIDPGEASGVAVIADGKIIDKANCFSVLEVTSKICNTLKNFNLTSTTVKIKIGSGVPTYKDLTEALDAELPPKVILEVVSEAGTNKPLKENKRSRNLRHILSATRIAARSGYIYPRRKTNESNS
jgi:hypothetical protein